MDSTRRERRAEIRDRCYCPILMLAGGEFWLGVMVGVFTDKFIVQRLTSLMWIGESLTEQDARVYDAARVLLPSRKSLEKLTTFYEKISKSKIPRVINGQTHPVSNFIYCGQTNLPLRIPETYWGPRRLRNLSSLSTLLRVASSSN
ncbi:hypothetical protein BYT27DRAFT_7316387 [Phlegmacium glaucopus]|nr:hypothetical protein BYT27DRAFT_7316387 [Phlegmacium glaucopus]